MHLRAGKTAASFALLPYGLAVALFLVLATGQLALPGLHYDEAAESGLPALQVLRGETPRAHREAVVMLLGRELPLMVQDYVGGLQVYLALPFVAVMGSSASAVRMMAVAMGALTLVALGALANALYGRRAAWVSMALLAVQPAFVFWSREAIVGTSSLAFLVTLFCWLLVRAHQTRQSRYLVLAAFAAGVGLYAKLLFVWVVVAAVVLSAARLLADRLDRARAEASSTPVTTVPALGPPTSRPSGSPGLGPGDGHRDGRGEMAHLLTVGLAMAAAFLLGVAPLIVFNAETGGTFSRLGSSLTVSYHGVDNRDVAQNLALRLDQLKAMLIGAELPYLPPGDSTSENLAPAAYLVVITALLMAAARATRQWWRLVLLVPTLLGVALLVPAVALAATVVFPAARSLAFGAGALGLVLFLTTERSDRVWWRLAPLAAIALMVLQSPFTPSNLVVVHFAPLVPLVPLMVGALVANRHPRALATAAATASGGTAFSPPRHPAHAVPAAAGGTMGASPALTSPGHPGRVGSAGMAAASRGHRAWPGVVIQALPLLLVGVLLVNDLRTTRARSAALAASGGVSTYSDAIYGLTDLLANAPGPVVALDWGIALQVQYLSGEKVRMDEVFGYSPEPDATFAEQLAPYLARPETLYVFHAPRDTTFPRRPAFEQLAGSRGALETVAVIRRRDGEEAFQVVRVKGGA